MPSFFVLLRAIKLHVPLFADLSLGIFFLSERTKDGAFLIWLKQQRNVFADGFDALEA
jgi:hypothetical protein